MNFQGKEINVFPSVPDRSSTWQRKTTTAKGPSCWQHIVDDIQLSLLLLDEDGVMIK